MLDIDIMRSQEPEKSCAKRITGKFQPQPELGHQVLHDQGHGGGQHVQGRGGRTDDAIGPIFFDNHRNICANIFLRHEGFRFLLLIL